MNKQKTTIILFVLMVISVLIVVIESKINVSASNLAESNLLSNRKTVLKQKVLGEIETPINQKVLYANNEIVGIVSNLDKIESMIENLAEEKYSETFPDSKLGFGEDVFIAEEMSNFIYEDIDNDIKDYIVSEDLLAIETNKITFSNGAIIYVKNLEDFETAKETYMLNFVSEIELDFIKRNEIAPISTEYGSVAQSLEILEKTTVSQGFASIDKILVDEREIIEFLSYGYGTEKEFYTVQPLDTVDGVASLAGISPQQLLTINPQIKSRDQLIKEGDKLNVTFFDSPINVIVKKKTVREEIVYPESTLYVNDPTLVEGRMITTVYERAGSKKVTYEEEYVNGQLKEGVKVLESQTLKEPVREVVKVGTMIIPNIGSGQFRYPVDNPRVTCGWYCYAGHTATDFINTYQRYGPVRASDRGTVEVASYQAVNGYYVWINHNNGYRTYYGHLNTAPYVRVGQTVSRGEIIGQIGQTGVATGPHVHFMVTLNGTYINPMTVVGR